MHLLIQSEVKPNPTSRLARTPFPALRGGYTNLIRVLIVSLDCHSVPFVIGLNVYFGFVSRHSIENHSKRVENILKWPSNKVDRKSLISSAKIGDNETCSQLSYTFL